MDIDNKIKDTFQRPIISMRISITTRCNIKCVYCHKDGIIETSKEMTPDEIFKICKIAKSLGIDKIRISGGEPLVRKDIVEIISKIATLNFKDVSITSNGTLLKKYAKDLFEAGLNRVNVSLDTMNPEIYKRITSSNYLNDAKEGIIAAVDAGLYPVKVNMVVMKNINENEIWDMFDFCREHGIILQLIELIEDDMIREGNPEKDEFLRKHHFKMDEIEEELLELADDIKTREYMQDRKKYYIEDGEIEIVKPMDNTKFCENCTRIRLTPDGKLKPCLLCNDNLIDLLTPLRENRSDEEIKKLFIDGVNNRKPYYQADRYENKKDFSY